MKKKIDLSKYDVSDRTQRALDYALAADSKNERNKIQGPKVAVREALKAPSQYEISSSRETTRLLIISQDSSLLNQTTQSLDGYLNLSDVFDEVHIVILQTGIRARNPVLRVAPNVWLYIASAKHKYQTISEAYKVISKQLMFAEGFRADVVVARDPFESALVAYLVGKNFSRPTQLHVMKDFFDNRFRLQNKIPKWKYFLSKIIIGKFFSIRTKTDIVAQKIKSMYPEINDISTLPRFYSVDELTEVNATFDVKEKYKQFSFIILYAGNLNSTSKAYQAIDVARTQMRNKKIGLVVLGRGDSINEFKKRTELLGIATQVVFEKNSEDLVSYLKTSDVVLIPDSNEESEELVLVASALKIPIIMVETQARTDLFENYKSALMFKEDDIPAFTNQLSKLLSEPSLRNELAINAQDAVMDKLDDDPLVYSINYRDSIEQAFFADQTKL